MKTTFEKKQKEVKGYKERVTQLEVTSPVDNGEEIKLLKQLILEKEKELEQFSPETMGAELLNVDEQSGLPLEVKEIVKGEFREEENAIAQEVEEIKQEIEVEKKKEEKKEETKQEEQEREKIEEDIFVNSFDLSQTQKGNLRSYIQEFSNPDIMPIYISRFENDLPQEIQRTEFIRTRAKRVFYNCIVLHNGTGSGGDWVDFMNQFGIEEEFFKQKDFIEYKRKEWISRISRGYRFFDHSRFGKTIWGNDITGDPEAELEIQKQKKMKNLRWGHSRVSG